MTHSQDDSGTDERRPAGPVGEGEALRAGASSTSPSPPPAGEADESEAQAVEADFDALLADAQKERDEYLELAQRTKADFENYRKRVAADVQAAAARGTVEVAAQLIGVIDNLERALEAVGVDRGGEKPPAEPLAEGFFLTYRELCAVLERAGI